MTEQKQFSTSLAKINNSYFPMIERQLSGNGIDMDDYSKKCVINAISSINQSLEVAGVDWNDKQLDQGNITQLLLQVASLKLNASARPNEIYFQVRNVKIKKNGKDEWKKQVEMGVEGDGNDAILSNFGRDVREVRQHWLVRENDKFEFPMYNGLDMEPPKWQPTGQGKVIRVVYPIIKTSGAVEYHIANREDVIKNLIAHINNNLMNETFGIAQNRFKATSEQKKQIQQKKDEILNKVEELGLDGALKDEEIKEYISPAWKDPQSRESMIVRKMRNNIVKKIPKDFGNAFVGLTYEDTTNDYQEQAKQEINENANSEVIDIDYEVHQEQSEQPDQEAPEQPEQEEVNQQHVEGTPPF